MCACIGQSKESGVFLSPSLPYILTQGLLLELEYPDLAGQAGWQTPEIPPVCASPTMGFQVWTFTQAREI